MSENSYVICFRFSLSGNC